MNENIMVTDKQDNKIISLKESYEKHITEGNLVRDIAQEKSLDALEDLIKIIAVEQSQQNKRHSWLYRFINKFRAKDEIIKGVYLYGPAGRGKSFVMDLFYEAAPVDKKKRMHFQEFMMDVHDALHVYRQRDIPSEKAIPILAAQLVKENNLLCFDELQINEVSDAMVVTRLFTEMFNAGLIMVSTSSFAPQDLYKDGIQRERFNAFVELVKKQMNIVPLIGKIDYRLERLRGCAMYYTPINAETRGEMDKIFQELTKHDMVEKKTVTVKGHLLHIPKASSTVARFTFQQLCGQPKGASDYLALARHFECILLEGVPVFEKDQIDLAKRFILMIDAFYEKKVKLIISSDVAIKDLYKQTPLKAEFTRVSNRLLEMQSLEYIESTHLKV